MKDLLAHTTSPTRVFLVDNQGNRKTILDASHVVFNEIAQMAVWQETHDQWLQPIGFHSAFRGCPWMLYTASDLESPSWMRVELINSALCILGLCGLDIDQSERWLNGTSLMKVNRLDDPPICNGTQITVDRRTGRLCAMYPAPPSRTEMITTVIPAPFVDRPSDVAWRRWTVQVVEIFALGGVALMPLGIEGSHGMIYKAEITQPEPARPPSP